MYQTVTTNADSSTRVPLVSNNFVPHRWCNARTERSTDVTWNHLETEIFYESALHESCG